MASIIETPRAQWFSVNALRTLLPRQTVPMLRRKGDGLERCRREEKDKLRQEEKSRSLRMQGQRAITKKRQEARLALQRIQRTVQFDDNLMAEKEFLSMIKGGSPIGITELGLCMKADDDQDAVS